MPRSAHSGSGGTSVHSSNSRRAPKYYKISHTSQVDESLFGSKPWNEKRKDDDITQKAKERSASRESSKSKDQVKVITKDLIRNLKVPDLKKRNPSVILNYDEFLMLVRDSKIMTAEEIAARHSLEKTEKEDALNEMHDRKQEMKAKDLERFDNEKLNDLEEEAQRKREYLNECAQREKQEQEDEIKKLNEMILNAKCHAIRELQTMEKVAIKGEEVDEVKRLDLMMEVERVKAIAMQEEILKKQKEERLIGKRQVMKQIEENDQKKLIELEKKDQENILQQQYVQRLCEEERQALMESKHVKAKHNQELNECNEKILKRKERDAYQSKLEEEKILQFQMEKAQREREAEEELILKRIEKEKEVARLRALQEREIDKAAEQDEMRARRAYEASEREWRKKEIEVAKVKTKQDAALKKAREEQLQQKLHYMAVQGERERNEFANVLRGQHELIEKEKQDELKKKQSQSSYKNQVIDQIKSKESEKIKEKQSAFLENIKIQEEAQKRRDELDALKLKKLRELELQGLDSKYTKEVARKANISLKVA